MTDPAIVQRAVRAPRSTGGACWARPSGSGGRSARPGSRSTSGPSVDFARALTLVDIGDREQVRAAGAAIFVRRRDDRATYDAVFDRWWRRRGSRLPGDFEPPPIGGQDGRRGPSWSGAASPQPGRRRRDDRAATRRGAASRCPTSDDEDAEDEAPIDGRRHLARRLQPGRGPAPSRVRPDDAGRAARGRAAGGPARAAPRAAADAPLRAPLARPAARAAGDVPAQPRDRRPADRLGLAAPDPRAALARGPVRHLGLDGAPLAAAAAVRPGAVGGVGGPDRVVRLRDAADARHAAAPGPRPRPRAGPRVRRRQRLGRRDADRRVVPDVQPAVGAADAADVGRRHRRLRRLGPRRPGARRDRDRPPAAQLPPAGLAQPARRARPATSRWPAGCAPPTRTSTTSWPAGTVANLERLGEILGGVRAGDTRRGSEAAAHAALPGVDRCRPSAAPPDVVGGAPTDPSAPRPIR